jgi:hypothetical protein
MKVKGPAAISPGDRPGAWSRAGRRREPGTRERNGRTGPGQGRLPLTLQP